MKMKWKWCGTKGNPTANIYLSVARRGGILIAMGDGPTNEDAALIAAAPVLLAALKHARAMVASHAEEKLSALKMYDDAIAAAEKA